MPLTWLLPRRPQFLTTLASSLGLHRCPHGTAAGLPPEQVIQERTGEELSVMTWFQGEQEGAHPKGHKYQEAGAVGGHLGGWMTQQLRS